MIKVLECFIDGHDKEYGDTHTLVMTDGKITIKATELIDLDISKESVLRLLFQELCYYAEIGEEGVTIL